MLRRCQAGGPWARPGLQAMSGLLDFYHTTNHTLEGLTQALRNALAPAPGEGLFTLYDEVYQDLLQKKYDLAGMLKELSTLRDSMTRVFLDDLNHIARESRLVLAFDTGERLLYETDRIQERLGLEPERVPILDWLLRELLPHLHNTVVLLAGRPKPEQLRADLRRALGDHLLECELGPFSPDDTGDYFDAVAARLRQAGEQVGRDEGAAAAGQIEAAAQRVADISRSTREVIWWLTAGQPILLSLTVDYLLASDQLHPAVLEPVEAVREWSSDHLEAIRKELKADLVRFWRETGRVVDPVIEALTWARRGLDAELLAHVASLWRDDRPDLEEAGRLLQDARGLSFVKFRPEDERLFLHDEMYALLDEHWRSKVVRPAREEIYQAILSCYKNRILQERGQVRELWTPRSEKIPDWDRTPLGQPKPPDNPELLAKALKTLYHSMSEEAYYRLRRDPVDGFQTYQVYAQEARWASEETLEYLLRSEILIFLDEHKGEERFDGLSRAEVDIDTGLRRQMRYNTSRREDAVTVAERTGSECADLLAAAGQLAPVHLKALEAEARIFLGVELERAQVLLEETVIKELGAYTPPADTLKRWQRDILWAEVHNNLGYLCRILGWFHRAEENYRQAVAQWRTLEQNEEDKLRRSALRAQHANTLNNRALALAELGRFEKAQTFCEDALNMRQELGSRAPVAFSLNTLGMILLRNDKPHQARVQCERALGFFRDLDQPRGIGLASTALAEAMRRMSGIEHLYAPEEIADLLRRAAAHATDAVQIFADVVHELPRLIEAFIERGCVLRHWTWLRSQYEPDPNKDDPDQATLARMAEQDLRQAAELAGDQLIFRHLDARVNLAWLYYYMARYDLFTYRTAEEEASAAIASVPEEYRWNQEHSLPDPQDPNLPHKFYWSLLGKAYMVLGQIPMQQFEEGKLDPRPSLRQAGKCYTLALAYDELFSPDYRDIRRAIHRIYGRTKRRNKKELAWLFEGVSEAAHELNLAEPTRLQKELDEQGITMGEAL